MNSPEQLNLTAPEMLRWWRLTSDNWRRLLTANAALLDAHCDIAGTANVAGLIQHIVAVSVRYAERLADQPVTEYTAIPTDSVDAFFAVHDRASGLFEQLLSSDVNWTERIEFETRRGKMRASRKAIFFHALLHGIRHYAQLATLARMNGVSPDWPMDFLMLDAERV